MDFIRSSAMSRFRLLSSTSPPPSLLEGRSLEFQTCCDSGRQDHRFRPKGQRQWARSKVWKAEKHSYSQIRRERRSTISRAESGFIAAFALMHFLSHPVGYYCGPYGSSIEISGDAGTERVPGKPGCGGDHAEPAEELRGVADLLVVNEDVP